MKKLALLITVFITIGFIFSQTVFSKSKYHNKKGAGATKNNIENVNSPSEVCLSKEEESLYKKIMAYRKKHKLPKIPLSPSLTMVAQKHALNQTQFKPKGKCSLHSWGKGGKWKPCCYDDQGKPPECMWDKPNEITGFDSTGFEITVFGYILDDDNTAGHINSKHALDDWKKSPSHNSLILNKEPWNETKWGAIGVGMHLGFANVWFTEESDPNGSPKKCKK